MRIIQISILVLLNVVFAEVKAQSKMYNYDTEITCDLLHNGIIDSKLYRWEDGRMVVIQEEWRKNEMMQLIVNDKIYFVSNKLAEKIQKTLKKEKCEGMLISPLAKVSDKGQSLSRD